MSQRKSSGTLDEEEQLVLLAVGALGQPLRSKVKMQKLIFLIGNVIEGLHEDLGYEPHLYGPYSDKVDYMAEDLEGLGYIEHEGSRFSLTPKGEDEYEQLNPSEDVRELVEDFKDFINDMTDDEVLTYIYTFFPAYIDEATEWERLKKDRVSRSVRLLRREKVSMSKAAAMAGMNSFDFAELLSGNKVKWR